MRVAIVHQSVSPDARPDEQDVLLQVAALEEVMHRRGDVVCCLPCTLNLAELDEQLEHASPDVVVNLVESLDGVDALQHLVPGLLEQRGWAFTGSSSEAIFVAGRKPLAKRLLRAAGLPAPASYVPGEETAEFTPGRWILKALAEHASLGMDDDDVLAVDSPRELGAALRAKQQALGRPCFAEPYLDGREFNLSLLEGPDGAPEVLPAAEIQFVNYPPGKPRIVGGRAKWTPGSFEYESTVRVFEFPATDGPLLGRLAALALASWRVLGLRGYARVDFRVDTEGTPWILEVNANPCLSPDAGFAAACSMAGLSFDVAVARILNAAAPRTDRPAPL